MKTADEEYRAVGNGIKKEVTGRFVYSFDATPITYEIKDYRTGSNLYRLIINIFIANEIVLRRVFDPEGILLQEKGV
jgi:hypothetical protein